jgi:deoxyhypusine monooxygenase
MLQQQQQHDMEVFLQQLLLDPNSPISDRWRALFTLRNLKGDGPRQALIKAMSDASNLLAHEAAFALGQMQDVAAIPALCTVLQDTSSFHPIVRHEAAEALGAIGAAECTPLLQESLVSDPAPEVQQTCELALHRIQQGQALDNTQQSPFLSVDPAVAALSSLSVADLRKVLLNENVPMYERYAALFGLRNHGDSEAVNAIVAALQAKSALLRHEVCSACLSFIFAVRTWTILFAVISTYIPVEVHCLHFHSTLSIHAPCSPSLSVLLGLDACLFREEAEV